MDGNGASAIGYTLIAIGWLTSMLTHALLARLVPHHLESLTGVATTHCRCSLVHVLTGAQANINLTMTTDRNRSRRPRRWRPFRRATKAIAGGQTHAHTVSSMWVRALRSQLGTSSRIGS